MAQHLAKQKKNNVENSVPVTENKPIAASASAATPVEMAALEPEKIVQLKIVPSPIQKSKNLNFSAFEEEENIVAPQELKTTLHELAPIAIDSNTFEESWQKYIQFLNDDGNAGLATSFAGIPYTLSINIIELEIASLSMQELILKNRSMLIDFFRKELNNATVDVVTRITENAQQMHIKSRSERDKLNDMVDRNPSVLKFIQDLGLELDL
jgi:hypothetical protein